MSNTNTNDPGTTRGAGMSPIEPPVAEPAQPVCSWSCGTEACQPNPSPRGCFHGHGKTWCSAECRDAGRSLSYPAATVKREPLKPPPVPPGPVPPEGEPVSVDAGTRTPITCDTPGCGRPIPPGGEGHPEICPTCLRELDARDAQAAAAPAKVPLSERATPPKPVSQEAIDYEVAQCRAMERKFPVSRPDCTAVVVALADQLATAIRERDEQRGRAEEAERDVDVWRGRADGAWTERNAAVQAEVEQLRAKLEEADVALTAVRVALGKAGIPDAEPYPEENVSDWERSLRAGGRVIRPADRIDRLSARAAESFRAGWHKGAEATREAVRARLAMDLTLMGWPKIAAAIDSVTVNLPLPPCPEGPPAGPPATKGDE